MAGKKRWGLICGLAVIGLMLISCLHVAAAQAKMPEEGDVTQEEETAWTDSEQEIMTLVGKYVCNAMVALIAAMLINYVVMMLSSQTRRTSDSELLEHTMSYYESNDPEAKYVSSTETYRTNWFVEIMKGLMVNPFARWK